eukprot:COSAG02_NODE_29113_length_576_cov_0.595388_1_plen_136_part_10
MVVAAKRRQRILLQHILLQPCGSATGGPTLPTLATSLPRDVTPAAPSTTADVADARRLLQRDGAVLFQCVAPGEASSLSEDEVVAHISALPSLLFGDRLLYALPPVCKRLGKGSGRERPGDLGVEPNSPHMDTAYG